MSAVAARLRARLGQRLGWVVKTSGKTHAELAAALGMHQTTLSACIRGEKFSVERISEVLERLGYPVEFADVPGEEPYERTRKKRGPPVPKVERKAEEVFIRVGPGGSTIGVRS